MKKNKLKNGIVYIPTLFPWTNLFPPVEEKLKAAKKPPPVKDEESEISFLQNRPVMDD